MLHSTSRVEEEALRLLTAWLHIERVMQRSCQWTTPLTLLCVRRKTIGEFRRTHEEAALAEAKKALTADQWDALQSVASPATYFA